MLKYNYRFPLNFDRRLSKETRISLIVSPVLFPPLITIGTDRNAEYKINCYLQVHNCYERIDEF